MYEYVHLWAIIYLSLPNLIKSNRFQSIMVIYPNPFGAIHEQHLHCPQRCDSGARGQLSSLLAACHRMPWNLHKWVLWARCGPVEDGQGACFPRLFIEFLRSFGGVGNVQHCRHRSIYHDLSWFIWFHHFAGFSWVGLRKIGVFICHVNEKRLAVACSSMNPSRTPF